MTPVTALPTRLSLLVLVLTVAMSVLPVHAAAQDASPGRALWLSAGLGTGAIEDGEGAALLGQLTYRQGVHHVILRATGMVGGLGSSDDPVGDLGVLYGRGKDWRWGHGTLGAGIARAGGDLCRFEPECEEGGRLALPLMAEVGLEPTRVIGIGLQIFANVNPARSFGGLVAMLELGWLP